MKISSLTLRDLEYLVAVANHRHFGRAAESCHVSQPALSAQIRKVEDFLGLQLFERSNRNVVITSAG
ncbi:MAG: LysR family transcriptional regulator, partial [Acidobacteria bacterium]